MNQSVREHFELQAQSCDQMGSPFTARICRMGIELLDEQSESGRKILNWQGDPRDDALSLRFAGALHALVLGNANQDLAAVYPPADVTDEKLSRAVMAAITKHDGTIAATLANAPQTNETARAAALLPGLLEVSRQTEMPLALHEIGSSAGLNLFLDRFYYRFGDSGWGDPQYPVTLSPEMHGIKAPDLSGELEITFRVGSDLAPINITDEQDRLRLRSYIWPDQLERLARIEAAIAVAQRESFELVEQDAAAFVEQRLQLRKPGECFVLFHSVVWQYLPQATKDRITSAMNEAGGLATDETPLAWLTMEGLGGVEPFATLHLTIWPDGELRKLAKADFHVRWIEWLD